MLNKNSKMRLFPIIMVGIFVLFSILGIAHIPGSIKAKVSFIKTEFQNITNSSLVLDNIIKEIAVGKTSAKTEKTTKKTKVDFRLLFYFFSSMVIAGDKSIIILLMVFIGVLLTFKKLFNIDYRSIFIPPDIGFFKNWILKFLTPLEKCKTYLATKYDINPILNIDVGWRPAFSNYKSECGSFFWINEHYQV